MRLAFTLLLALILSACANKPVSKHPIPKRSDSSSINQLAKTDFDRMADMEFQGNTESLRTLMVKLYKRNPHELAKSNHDSAEKMAASVFDKATEHQWQFEQLGNKQDTAAIFLAFDTDYQGDRVLSFIVGLQTMLAKAHNNKTAFYMTDDLDPEINETERNLSFEREFGKIIGRTDFYAIALAEKSQRLISRVAQGLASAIFLPF